MTNVGLLKKSNFKIWGWGIKLHLKSLFLKKFKVSNLSPRNETEKYRRNFRRETRKIYDDVFGQLVNEF